MKKFLRFSCVLLSICAFCDAQFYERQLISPAGAYFEETNIQITWVLGDLVNGAYNIGQLIVPYGTDVPHDDMPLSSVKLFPNPTKEKVYLILNLDDYEKYSYWLYDILGREIQNGKISGDRTELNFTPFCCGIYILRLLKENALIQEFKIVKQ